MNKVCMRQESISGEYKILKISDSGAFEQFYLTFKDKVYNYLLLKTNGNREITEDVMSETFHSALKSVSTLKNKANLSGWIIRIAQRRLADYYTKNIREQKIVEIMKRTTSVYTDNIGVKRLIKNEKIMHFNKAIKQIKPKYFQIIKLKYFEKKSQKEIAGLMNKHEKAVEGLLFRARTALKKEMEKMNEGKRDPSLVHTYL
ncbi:MAG: RNA polymerase sigma factor [Spirochaetales bacterium]|nr:RNA polymerase sigma factor [Spirochaetales bacterium]